MGEGIKGSIRILVATHKAYWMPSDPMYLPLHVGAEGKKDAAGRPLDLGFIRDNTGDNISGKNPFYCELTGVYWAWKNLDAEVIGVTHYRRHFTVPLARGNKRERVLTREQLEPLLAKDDVLLPTPRRYWIESNYSQYVHAHHAADLDTTRQILQEMYPGYLPAFDRCMKRRYGHRFNMLIMKRPLFDAYCQWLFDVLFELEKRLDISEYSAYDRRVFGFVSERLLDVWMKANHVAYRNIPYVFLEKQNWLIKGGSFLQRKFRGKWKKKRHRIREDKYYGQSS